MSAAGTARRSPGDRRPNGRAPRLLFPTNRADLRVTWHEDDDAFILSLWHGDVCVGTAPLSASDAAEVASFVVSQLGQRVSAAPPQAVEPVAQIHQSRAQPLMKRLAERFRGLL